MAVQKTNTTTKPSKSEFIREQPSAMSAADVIAKGKGEGITLSTDLVYGVRSRARVEEGDEGRGKEDCGEKGPRDEARADDQIGLRAKAGCRVCEGSRVGENG
jgi:hypothetical protein